MIAFLIAVVSGAMAASIVCRAIHLRLALEMGLGVVSVCLFWLSLSIAQADETSILGAAMGYGLAVLAMRLYLHKEPS